MKFHRPLFSKASMLSSLIALTSMFSNVSVECKAEQTNDQTAKRKHSYFVVFTEDGQKSAGDIAADAGATVTGKAGSVFRTSTGGVMAIQGNMLFTTSNKAMSIFTRSGKRTDLQEKSSGLVSVSSGTDDVQPLDGTARDANGRFDLQAEIDRFCPQKSVLTREPLRVIASEGSLFSAEDHKLNVYKGFLLIAAPAASTIATPGGILHFPQQSLVSVRIFNNTVCVENCSVPNGLDFSVKGTTLHLAAGGACILSNGKPQPALVPLDGVARRNFAAYFDGRITAITSEFHPLSLFRSNVDFRDCVKHPITKAEQQIADELLKGTAALTIVTSKRGAYCLRPQNLPVFRLGAFLDPFAQPGLL